MVPALAAYIPSALKALNIASIGAVASKYFPKARGAVSGLFSRAGSAVSGLSRDVKVWLGVGGGAATGYGTSEIFNALGIEEKRTQKIMLAAAALISVLGLGQLVDLNYNL